MPTANPPGRTLWLMAAIVLVGLNLRPSMAAVGPLLNAMRGEIALSFGDVSLLTALPVLTLGLGMFFGLGIARRVGEWRSVALALLLIGAASALRLGSRGLPDLLGSAMLAGLGIALIQALMPALIKARFGARTPLCMGLYVTAIMAGAALSASAAPTLAEHAGWRLGLGAWAALAALALLPGASARADGGAEADAPVRLVIATAGLTWEDIDTENTPTLQCLADRSGVGAMNTTSTTV